MTRDEAAALKSNMHVTFESPQGKEIMRYIEKIGSWIPTVYDSMDTNAIVARDANRRLIGTLKTIMELNPEQIAALTEE
jgi:hypothetical protein